MGKSIVNLYRYAEISKTANKRFLDSMCHVIPQKSMEEEINHVCQKKTVKGKTYSGYNVWSPETFHLFETICEGRYLIRKIPHSRKYLGSDKGRRLRGICIWIGWLNAGKMAWLKWLSALGDADSLIFCLNYITIIFIKIVLTNPGESFMIKLLVLGHFFFSWGVSSHNPKART